MLIAIPSRGRASKQETLKWLPGHYLNKAQLVVPIEEGYHYRREHSNVITTPAGVRGIGPTRQWICDFARECGEYKVLMLDDDLDFAVRREDAPTLFQRATGVDVGNALHNIDALLEQYAMVHMAHREGANRNTESVVRNTRALRVLGYRLDVLRDLGLRFDNIPVMEDFDIQLGLLTNGYETLCLNTHVHNQARSGAEGGCSVYRTSNVQQAAAVALAAKYPKVVRTVVKKGWKDWDDLYRTDVIVQWKRAYDSAPEKRAPRVLDDGARGCTQEQGSGGAQTVDEG